jgi:uncharacterized protein YgbK (DUF1537 family)
MALLYTFYADDFTGSTDVLEQLASNGVPTVLYLAPPTPAQLAAFPEARAIGIAGDSRSRTPKWMSTHLPAIFTALKALQSPVVHYKVCSTFDSSPTRGSIGRAIELGLEIFHPLFVPIVVGAPHLRRYVVFGNLFAAAPDGVTYRIDRHPMARHPVTPMREADLRVHLQAQTALPIGLVDLEALQAGTASTALGAEIAAGKQAILFDTTDIDSLTTVGEILWQQTQQHPLFSASSSGLTAAFISAMRNAGRLPERIDTRHVEEARPLLVLSGSCSAVTERQLRYALAHGYHGIALDPAELLDPQTAASAHSSALQSAIASLTAGRDTILYTTLGLPAALAHGDALGRALGSLLREILEQTEVRRVLLCGGDTTSHAVQQLGLYALTWLANLQPGAPLCRAHAVAGHPGLQNLELVLKGGQVGTDDFFDVVRGSPA